MYMNILFKKVKLYYFIKRGSEIYWLIEEDNSNYKGLPCENPGCFTHLTNPCGNCKRIAGKKVVASQYEFDLAIYDPRIDLETSNYTISIENKEKVVSLTSKHLNIIRSKHGECEILIDGNGELIKIMNSYIIKVIY